MVDSARPTLQNETEIARTPQREIVAQPEKEIVANNRNATNATTDGNPNATRKTNTNATNATMQPVATSRVASGTIEFAKPSGWGDLWRLERNGKYFFYRLRFTDSGDVPQELKRITQPGGKITPEIEAALRKRKGQGRHKESREEAERHRRRAIAVAGQFRPGAGGGIAGQGISGQQDSNSGAARGHDLPTVQPVDDGDDVSCLSKSSWVM